jgi:hypothetical protein
MRMLIALIAPNVQTVHPAVNHAHPAQVEDRNQAVYSLAIVILAQIQVIVVLVKILMICNARLIKQNQKRIPNSN